MCDKVCQYSMMIFLFIYVYLSVCELGLCSVERRKYMRGSHFFHTKREAWVCSGQLVFYFNYTCMYTIREYLDYITEPCLYTFSCILLVNDV